MMAPTNQLWCSKARPAPLLPSMHLLPLWVGSPKWITPFLNEKPDYNGLPLVLNWSVCCCNCDVSTVHPVDCWAYWLDKLIIKQTITNLVRALAGITIPGALDVWCVLSSICMGAWLESVGTSLKGHCNALCSTWPQTMLQYLNYIWGRGWL